MKHLVKVLVGVAGVLMIATPVLAASADYSFYGSVRVKTFYEDSTDYTTDDKDFTVDLQPNTRFGAKVKMDDFFGHFEFGLKTQSSGSYTRLAYGTFKTEAGKLLVGQTYSPYFSNASQVFHDDRGFSGFGNLWDSRNPQIRFDLDNGTYFAATKVTAAKTNLGAGANVVTETTLPKLTVGYKAKRENIAYNLGAVYQSFDSGANKEGVDSYLGYIDLSYKVSGVALRTKLHYGQNLSDLGITDRNSKYNIAQKKDTTSYGGWLQAGFGNFTTGIGYVVDDTDLAGAEKDEQMGVFANYKYKISKRFTITPEICYLDYMDDTAGVDQGDHFAIGAQWKMDF